MTDRTPLPADLAKPRRVVTGYWPGIIIGLVLLAADLALLALALTVWA
jgi:hypothetical protein